MICEHPLIVIGLPVYNEAPFIAQTIASLKSQLANFKIPKQCHVVAELPRNTMGKVQKNLLREQYKNAFA